MKSKNTIPNIWTAQENMIHFYRILSLGLGALAIISLVVSVAASFRDPIVVLKSGMSQEYHHSQRAAVAIEKADVERMTRKFLEALYVWPEFNRQALAKEITPYVEDALVEKIVETQASKYGKDFKGKKLSQEIIFVKVDVFDDRVVCTFDRVLKIENIPLVIPTQVTLSMLQGGPTRLNPMGVFISGIIENEGSK